ncbi:cytidine deaminase-like [Phlebotomus argentipes]|uniref:cytidine deaminase-like n=1 Tax=Phlebotomus argentipes TaxID=94469 RepID=UPI0028930D17|nr:cytidine deaminase-like [Phlebotomus argentipes]
MGDSDKVTTVEFKTLSPANQELIEAAIEVRKKAYCPYSKFAVGAAIRTPCGRIFTGCNIETSTYTPCICAERTAAAKAISEGFREFSAVAVVGQQEKSFTTPCGVCREFLSEFADKDITIYVAKPAAVNVMVTSLFQLLPHRFQWS